MNILDKFKLKESWENYLKDLTSKKEYLDRKLIKNVTQIINSGLNALNLNFPIPVKKELQKYNTSKKRLVYFYPEPYNTYLKMINWLLQVDSEYASKFCINSYAYQKNKSVNIGIKSLQKEILAKKKSFFIKSDFSDYFNSINVNILENKMKSFFRQEDQDLVNFILQLLYKEEVYVNNQIKLISNKGVMAGTPVSGYLANIYMNEVDWEMYKKHIYYIRYADDVFIMTNKPQEDLEFFENQISSLNITLNPKKTSSGKVEEGFTVLGFHFKNDIIDVDEAKVQKMMNRIRRRSRWFKRWEKSNKVKNEVMVRTFIKGMNAKLYSGDDEDRLNWSRWYFANINTTKSLEKIDAYMVQYIRFLISGKHLGYKKNSEVSYEYIKKLGYKSLVNNYWKYKKEILKNINDQK
jgi:hypothetical protein